MLNRDTKTKNDYLLEKGCKLDHKIKSIYFEESTVVSERPGTISTLKKILFYRTAETQNC
jgi:hypothetical protein